LNQWTEWNFNRDMVGPGGNVNANTQFKNYWNFNFTINYNGDGLSSTELRGGQALKIVGNKSFSMSLSSNDQKKLTAEVDYSTLGGNIKDTKQLNSYGLIFGYRPSKSLKITLSPNFSTNNDRMQYVDQQVYSGQTDYIFARINQTTLSASLRVNYNITPDLSIQYWGQPFLSSGKYSEFKKITNARAEYYNDRFSIFTGDNISYDPSAAQYSINDASGKELYRFNQPDFNVKEFLSNMVIRWEYLPGTTIYLVWSQTRNQSVSDGNFNLHSDLSSLFDNKPYNVFLLKLSFRIGR